MSAKDLQQSWQSLRRPIPAGHSLELDWERTLARIEQEGCFADVVLRPVQLRKAELLLLVDDSNAMLPFRPMLQPFIAAVQDWLHPAQTYRFSAYPEDFLTPWERPTEREPLSLILSRLHRRRTVVLILSDAGAVSQSYSDSRDQGITEFLLRLAPCVRQLLWLNPLPPERWRGTTAAAINGLLNGAMLPLAPQPVRAASRQATTEVRLTP